MTENALAPWKNDSVNRHRAVDIRTAVFLFKIPKFLIESLWAVSFMPMPKIVQQNSTAVSLHIFFLQGYGYEYHSSDSVNKHWAVDICAAVFLFTTYS